MAEALKTEGGLAERDFPHLVQELGQTGWTGLLTLTKQSVGKSITLREGRMVWATSSSRDDRLGELLFRRGAISLEQYLYASRAVVPGKRFGAILIEQRALDPSQLVKFVTEHVREIIYGAFQWTEGRYLLQPGPDAAGEAITLKMSTPDIILEGIRRVESWGRIEKGLGGVDSRYALATGYEAHLKNMTLFPEERALITLTQEKDVMAICKASSLPNFEACRLLWGFRVIGLVRRVEDAPKTVAPEIDDEGLGMVISGE